MRKKSNLPQSLLREFQNGSLLTKNKYRLGYRNGTDLFADESSAHVHRWSVGGQLVEVGGKPHSSIRAVSAQNGSIMLSIDAPTSSLLKINKYILLTMGTAVILYRTV